MRKTQYNCAFLLVLSIAISLGSGCASKAPEQATDVNIVSAEPASSDTKAQQLSESKTTTIQTTNGPISIEPTVISATDQNMLEELTVDYYDPLESFNRKMFAFNHVTYKYALIPLADGYKAVFPEAVRSKVTNAFDNIREPLNLLNNTFSGNFVDAGANLGRFLLNSTIGILGLFDPASSWFEVAPKKQTIGDTLADYGVGSGAYVVLPILGMSDLRNSTSLLGESFIHPIPAITDSPTDTYLRSFDGFNDFSAQSSSYITLYEKASDPYEYFRNQYIQQQNRLENEVQKSSLKEIANDEQ